MFFILLSIFFASNNFFVGQFKICENGHWTSLLTNKMGLLFISIMSIWSTRRSYRLVQSFCKDVFYHLWGKDECCHSAHLGRPGACFCCTAVGRFKAEVKTNGGHFENWEIICLCMASGIVMMWWHYWLSWLSHYCKWVMMKNPASQFRRYTLYNICFDPGDYRRPNTNHHNNVQCTKISMEILMTWWWIFCLPNTSKVSFAEQHYSKS